MLVPASLTSNAYAHFDSSREHIYRHFFHLSYCRDVSRVSASTNVYSLGMVARPRSSVFSGVWFRFLFYP